MTSLRSNDVWLALDQIIRAGVQREIGAFDKDDIQKLVESGFPLSHYEANRKEIVSAFKTFKEKFGHLNVVVQVVVASRDQRHFFGRDVFAI